MALASFVGLSSLAAETVELKLEFPPPLVISTPAPIKVPHLEQPGRKPPKIMVPADVTNVAERSLQFSALHSLPHLLNDVFLKRMQVKEQLLAQSRSNLGPLAKMIGIFHQGVFNRLMAKPVLLNHLGLANSEAEQVED